MRGVGRICRNASTRDWTTSGTGNVEDLGTRAERMAVLGDVVFAARPLVSREMKKVTGGKLQA